MRWKKREQQQQEQQNLITRIFLITLFLICILSQRIVIGGIVDAKYVWTHPIGSSSFRQPHRGTRFSHYECRSVAY